MSVQRSSALIAAGVFGLVAFWSAGRAEAATPRGTGAAATPQRAASTVTRLGSPSARRSSRPRAQRGFIKLPSLPAVLRGTSSSIRGMVDRLQVALTGFGLRDPTIIPQNDVARIARGAREGMQAAGIKLGNLRKKASSFGMRPPAIEYP
jgi:hypothetical protein